MHAVNLLPRQVVVAEKRSLQPFAVVGGAAVPVIASILIVIGYSSSHSTVSAEKAQFAALEAQIAKLGGATSATTSGATQSAAATQATTAQWDALISERTARRTELDGVLTQELPWDSILRSVARILPSDVWLNSLTATSPVSFGTPVATSGPAGAPATNFTIGGYGESEKSIALLLVRLRLLPILSNVNLGTSTGTQIGGKALVQFTVTATIAAPAGAAPAIPAPATTTPATTTTASG